MRVCLNVSGAWLLSAFRHSANPPGESQISGVHDKPPRYLARTITEQEHKAGAGLRKAWMARPGQFPEARAAGTGQAVPKHPAL